LNQIPNDKTSKRNINIYQGKASVKHSAMEQSLLKKHYGKIYIFEVNQVLEHIPRELNIHNKRYADKKKFTELGYITGLVLNMLLKN